MTAFEYIFTALWTILPIICVAWFIKYMYEEYIIDIAKKNGCDYDGDIVRYKKRIYYVDVLNGKVERIRKRGRRL